MVELGIISDEVGDDFEESCARLRAWGLPWVELRTLWGKNVLELSASELERARSMLEAHDLKVSAIASPIFKSPLDEQATPVAADFALAGAERFGAQLRLLERACDLCDHFGTRTIRIFTFWREPWSKELVASIADKLLQAAELANEREVRLVVENEPVCNVRYGRELAELFAELEARAPASLFAHLAILWDPGNALYAGERAYPDGYEALPKSSIAHVHLKDVAFDENGKPACVPLGQGALDITPQLQQLAKDGYQGPLVLEPHYRPKGMTQLDAAYSCVKAARQVLLEAFG